MPIKKILVEVKRVKIGAIAPKRSGGVEMNTALNKCDAVWKQVGKECDVPRTDATFTEIYELVFYNKVMVQSELGVLLQLIQKKLMETAGKTSACTGRDACRAIEKKNMTIRIRSV